MRLRRMHPTRLLTVLLILIVTIMVAPAPVQAETKATYTYVVEVEKGYLALRNHPSYDESNEIGELYTGDVVYTKSPSDSTYWEVTSPKLGKTGWVNKNYLRKMDTTFMGDYRVKVDKGYLALRTAPSYDESNEIGELHTGDVVSLVTIPKEKDYYYVYSPKLQRYGYVNKNYLQSIRSGSSSSSSAKSSPDEYTVKVEKGYLALRTKPAYDESNEIGELYTGDRVRVKNKREGKYWYVWSYKYERSGFVDSRYLVKK